MLSNYSFTVTIPKFKNVYYTVLGGYGEPQQVQVKRQFGKMPFCKQEQYFADLVESARILIGPQDFALPPTWVVEKFPSDPTRYHMHGTLYEITVDKMQEIQTKWAEKIGFKQEKQINDFINKLDSPYAWDFYLQKDQVQPSITELIESNVEDCFDCVYKFKGNK